MSSEFFILCSMTLTHGAAIGFALWELARLRRYRAGDEGRDRRPLPLPAPRPTGGEPCHKPLPACLIPPPRASARPPVRVLEDA